MARSRELQVVVRALEGFTSRLVRQVVLDATANLIEDTPRDTGWAAANWVPEVGTPSSEPAPRPTESASQISARQRQQTKIAEFAIGYDISQGDVTIYNNVPYIQRLNEGHSKQAPSGFIEAAVLRAVARAGRTRAD